MTTTKAEERVAVLLNLLGADVADSVLDQLSPSKRNDLRRSLDEIDQAPPSAGTINQIISDFERQFQQAEQAADGGTNLQLGSSDNAQAAKHAGGGESETDEPFELSDDPLEDLTRLQAPQIAGAVQDESPRTIAMVVDCLPSAQAAAVLSSLPDDARREVFLKLNDDLQAPAELLQRIVATMVEKASVLDGDSLSTDESDNSQKIADLLRQMERAQRGEMLEALEESDAEAAAKVKDLLYVFDDLLAIEDRSLQKLLTEVDSRTLATSLKDGDPALIAKVVQNFSKRARAALMEEMEYMGAVPEDEQQAARKEIVDVIARLDQSGELVMET